MSHVGLGWRSPHYQALLERREPLAFLEVHSENFFADGGAAMEVLRQGREAYDISLHGVGLALGSAAGLDPWHLDQLAALVERVQPVRVSDHASFARAPLSPGQVPMHGADLLPVAFSPAALDIMVRNVQQVQDRLRRPLLVENLSAYVRWTTSTMSEADFLNELTRRSGCGLLLDLNNLVVNALNAAEPDPVAAACAVVDALLPDVVGEIHLAGYNNEGVLVIDDHGSRVHEPVWQVYAHALARFGRVPTLIEWDTDVPSLDVLLDEVRRAESVSQAVSAAQREAA
jgi:uncharacterized protein (UPF0276 family)